MHIFPFGFQWNIFSRFLTSEAEELQVSFVKKKDVVGVNIYKDYSHRQVFLPIEKLKTSHPLYIKLKSSKMLKTHLENTERFKIFPELILEVGKKFRNEEELMSLTELHLVRQASNLDRLLHLADAVRRILGEKFYEHGLRKVFLSAFEKHLVGFTRRILFSLYFHPAIDSATYGAILGKASASSKSSKIFNSLLEKATKVDLEEFYKLVESRKMQKKMIVPQVANRIEYFEQKLARLSQEVCEAVNFLPVELVTLIALYALFYFPF